MTVASLRKLVRDSATQTLFVCMDDGARYPVSWPDLTLFSPKPVLTAALPGKLFQGCRFLICPVSRIDGGKLSTPRSKSKAAQYG